MRGWPKQTTHVVPKDPAPLAVHGTAPGNHWVCYAPAAAKLRDQSFHGTAREYHLHLVGPVVHDCDTREYPPPQSIHVLQLNEVLSLCLPK